MSATLWVERIVGAAVAGVALWFGVDLLFAATADYIAQHVRIESEAHLAWRLAYAVVASAVVVAYFAHKRRFAMAVAVGLIALTVDLFLIGQTMAGNAETRAREAAPIAQARQKREAVQERVRQAGEALRVALKEQGEATQALSCKSGCNTVHDKKVADARAERDRERAALELLPNVRAQTMLSEWVGMTDAQIGLTFAAIRATAVNALPSLLVAVGSGVLMMVAFSFAEVVPAQPAAPVAPAVEVQPLRAEPAPKRATITARAPARITAVPAPRQKSLPKPSAADVEHVEEFALASLVPAPGKRAAADELFGAYETWCKREGHAPRAPEIALPALKIALSDAGLSVADGYVHGVALKAA